MKCIYTRVMPLYCRHDVLQILYHWNYLFPPGGTVRVAISNINKRQIQKKNHLEMNKETKASRCCSFQRTCTQRYHFWSSEFRLHPLHSQQRKQEGKVHAKGEKRCVKFISMMLIWKIIELPLPISGCTSEWKREKPIELLKSRFCWMKD